MKARWWLAGLLCLALTAQGQSAPDERTAVRLSQGVVGKTIGDYQLYDRDGQPVRLSRYRGKPLLVNFIYTGCFQVCPASIRFLGKAIREAQATLGTGTFQVISVGFNLPYDTPSALREFARRHAIDLASWEFLSPHPASLDRLTRDFGFSYTATPKGFDHITQVSIVDARGKIVRQVYGADFELPMLIAPLKEMITGAPAPAYDLAAILERVRVLCTVYDPRAGRYRLDYGLVIELLTGITIIIATLYVLLSAWWRHARTP